MNTSRFLSMLVFSYNSCLYKIKERERLFFLKKKSTGVQLCLRFPVFANLICVESK